MRAQEVDQAGAWSDQERALQRAAAAAVEATVVELDPLGRDRAEQLAMVV